MYITITLIINKFKIDIRVDKRQKISALFDVLKSKGLLDGVSSPNFYKSLLNKRTVSSFNTFEDENIYSGDVLKAILWLESKTWTTIY